MCSGILSTDTNSGRQITSFTRGSGNAYRDWWREKIKCKPDAIEEIDVEQCMVHPQRAYNPLSPNQETDRTLRWKECGTTNTRSMRFFIIWQIAPLRYGTQRLWSLINNWVWKHLDVKIAYRARWQFTMPREEIPATGQCSGHFLNDMPNGISLKIQKDIPAKDQIQFLNA